MKIQDIFLDKNNYYSLMNINFGKNATINDYQEIVINEKYANRIDLLAQDYYRDSSYYMYILLFNLIDNFNVFVVDGQSGLYKAYVPEITYNYIKIYSENDILQTFDVFSNYSVIDEINYYNDVSNWSLDLWVSGTSYVINNNVEYLGKFYRCIEYNSDIDFDVTKWTIITDYVYNINDYVIYQNYYYKCNTANNTYPINLTQWDKITNLDFSGKYKYVLIENILYKLDRTRGWFGIDNENKYIYLDRKYRDFKSDNEPVGIISGIEIQGLFISETNLNLRAGQIIKVPTQDYINRFSNTFKKEVLGL